MIWFIVSFVGACCWFVWSCCSLAVWRSCCSLLVSFGLAVFVLFVKIKFFGGFVKKCKNEYLIFGIFDLSYYREMPLGTTFFAFRYKEWCVRKCPEYLLVGLVGLCCEFFS